MPEIMFESLLERMRALHTAKDHDYAGGGERYANFRGSTDLGIPPHIGAALRMRDKFSRAMHLLRDEWAADDARGPAVASETVEDTLLDLANYALIVICLRSEWDDERFSPAAVTGALQRLAEEPVVPNLPGPVRCAYGGCPEYRQPNTPYCSMHVRRDMPDASIALTAAPAIIPIVDTDHQPA